MDDFCIYVNLFRRTMHEIKLKKNNIQEYIQFMKVYSKCLKYDNNY